MSFGNQLEFETEAISHDLDGQPSGNRIYPGGVPCVVRITVTYTGGDPDGVATWKAQTVATEASTVLSPPLPSQLEVEEGDYKCPLTEDGSSALQLVSSDSTTLVMDAFLGHTSKPDGTPWDHPVASNFLVVNAIAATEEHRLTELLGCVEYRPVRLPSGDYAKAELCGGYSSVLGTMARHGYRCRDWEWKIAAVDDAGPFLPGEDPSPAGKMITIRYSKCHQNTPSVDGPPVEPPNLVRRKEAGYNECTHCLGPKAVVDFPRRQLGEDCCDLSEKEIEEFFPYDAYTEPNVTYDPGSGDQWDGTEPRTKGAGGYYTGESIPPRPPSLGWENGKSPPRSRVRWPLYQSANASGEPIGPINLEALPTSPIDPPGYSWELTGQDPIYGGNIENAARVVFIEVFLGECSEYLMETRTCDWDFDSDDGERTKVMQNACLYQTRGTEIDLDRETTTISDEMPPEQKRAYVVNAGMQVTGTTCQCCGCELEWEYNGAVQGYVPTGGPPSIRYVLNGNVREITYSYTHPEEYFEFPGIGHWITTEYTETWTYKLAEAEFDQATTDYYNCTSGLCGGNIVGVYPGGSYSIGYVGLPKTNWEIITEGESRGSLVETAQVSTGDYENITQIDWHNEVYDYSWSRCFPSKAIMQPEPIYEVYTGYRRYQRTEYTHTFYSDYENSEPSPTVWEAVDEITLGGLGTFAYNLNGIVTEREAGPPNGFRDVEVGNFSVIHDCPGCGMTYNFAQRWSCQ